MKRRISAAALMLAAGLSACAGGGGGAASAVPVDDGAEKGRDLLAARCGGCHAVGSSGASPLQAAPAFRDLHRRYRVADLQEALAEGLVTTHAAMPEVSLEAGEIADVIAYLESLGPGAS